MSTTTRTTDWVSITLKDYTSPKPIMDLLGLDFLPMPKGMHGYRGQFAADGGNVRVLFDGEPGMGVHVQISGSACRLLEAVGRVKSWPEFVRELLDFGARFARLDLAVDCFRSDVSVERCLSALNERTVTSRWRKYRYIHNGCVQTAVGEGDGLELGRRGGDMFLRIYDKRLERIQAGEDCEHEHWTRFEYQARDDRAQLLAELLADGQEDKAFGILRGYLEFREYRLDSNPSMAPAAAWWAEVCNCAKLVVKVGRVVAACVERAHHWMVNQVAPVLAVLVERERDRGGSFESAILDYVTVGRRRWKDRHRLMANASFAGIVSLPA